MTVADVTDAKDKGTAFFAPRYRLEFGHQELHERGGDVLSVQFKDSVKDLSGVEVVLLNVDDDGTSRPRYKYSDGGTLVDLGQQLDLHVGYTDAPSKGLARVFVGEITAFDPQFPATGTPTVTVRGLDRLHRMRNRPRSDKFVNKTDREIAKAIARRNGFGRHEIDETSIRHAHVPQDNTDDLSFLVERAKRINYEVYVRNDTFFFVRTREGRDPVLTLEYGSSLVSFAPSLTLNQMVSKVTVRSWHPESGALISETVDRSSLRDLGVLGTDGGKLLEKALGEGKEEVITSEAVKSKEEARELARAVLQRNAHSFVTGQGETVGIPQLRAGINIRLEGLGQRFDGTYYVTESTHRIDSGGYKTNFSVRRAYVG